MQILFNLNLKFEELTPMYSHKALKAHSELLVCPLDSPIWTNSYSFGREDVFYGNSKGTPQISKYTLHRIWFSYKWHYSFIQIYPNKFNDKINCLKYVLSIILKTRAQNVMRADSEIATIYSCRNMLRLY